MQRTAMYRQQPLHRQVTDCTLIADHVLGVSHRNTPPHTQIFNYQSLASMCCVLTFKDARSLYLSLPTMTDIVYVEN